MTVASGTRLGRYEVRSPLGAGGMGEVYLALDAELERTVALKILPADVATDQQRMNRFMQEARAASALNHPNILTIYEIGVADSGRFIATEFIDGVTLRKRMAGARLSLRESLDIGIQIASALVAAHAAGITHRDIKPENVMVRTDGYIKVLDFGLAKLTERERQPPPDTEAPTRAMVNTDPGVVMGTAAYMSPEQAGGLRLDARTDIWSLGVVIYEMITGHLPFEGATTSHMIVSILEKEPTSLRAHLRDAPEALEWIVTKALAKDREERYQVVKDLLLDLKKLRQRLEVEAEIERSSPPDRISGAMSSSAAALNQATASTSTVMQATPTGEMGGAHPTTSAEYLVGQISHHKKWVFVGLALVILLPIIAGIIYLPGLLNRNKTPAPFQNMKITRLTTTGKASDAAISPDGRYVVHVMEDGGQQSLWVRQVNTASNVPIVPPAEVNYQGLTFSRDGDYIYYVRQERNTPVGVLYQVPVLGGASRKILEDIDTPVDFSPDNKRLTFGRYYPAERESAVMVANADGTGEHKLAVRKRPEFFSTGAGPVWSPDGKVIACVAGDQGSTANTHQLAVVEVASGAVKPIGSARWYNNGRLAWLADGSGLVMPAASQVSEFLYQQIWYVSYPGGEARKITNDLNNYVGIGLTADSKSLVTVQFALISNIWTAPNGDASGAKQITSGGGKSDGIDGVVWTPDGKIVYRTTASGNEDLWIMEADGSNQKQLTANQSANYSPAVTADGRYVVFVSDRTGKEQIWRMNIDGSDPRQLTTEGGANPSCSPDGRWIVYDFNATLWRIGIDGGQPLQLTTSLTASSTISPDGKQLACFYRAAPISAFQIAILPSEGGQPLKVFDLSKNIVRWPGLSWTADGRSVIYVDASGGVSNLWSQPVEGGAPKQLTDFKTDSIFSYDWSRDGRQLVLSRGVETNDVVVIRDYK